MTYVVQTDELKMKRAGESDHHEGGSAISILGSKDESKIFNAHLQSYAAGGATLSHQHDNREQYFYVLEGEGTFIVEGEEFPVRPGSFVFIPANTEHSYRTGQQALKFLMMQAFFSEDEMRAAGALSRAEWNEARTD